MTSSAEGGAPRRGLRTARAGASSGSRHHAVAYLIRVWAHWSWWCPSCGCSRPPCRGRPTRGCPGSRPSGRRTRPASTTRSRPATCRSSSSTANSIITVTAVTLGYLFFSSLIGLRLCQGPLPVPGTAVPALPDDPVHPVPDEHDPALPPDQGPGTQQQPRGPRAALPRRRLRHLPHASGDACPSPMTWWTPRASTVPASSGSTAPSCCRCVGPALVTLAVISVLWRWNDVLWPLAGQLQTGAVHRDPGSRHRRS